MSFTNLLSQNMQLKYGPAPAMQELYGVPTNSSTTKIAVQNIQQTITSIMSQPLYAGMVLVFFSIGIIVSAFKLYESFRYSSKR